MSHEKTRIAETTAISALSVVAITSFGLGVSRKVKIQEPARDFLIRLGMITGTGALILLSWRGIDAYFKWKSPELY